MISEIKFLKEIDPKDSEYKYVYVDLVHRCNMECNNCYLPNRDFPDVEYDDLINFIDKFTIRTEFRLIGGEPTLYDRLSDVIKYITEHKLNHRVTLVTNGLKLASKRYVKSLKDAGLNRIYLSMNGFDEDDIYEKIDDMKCAKLKMKALENILVNKIGMSVGFIVVKGLNEHLIDKMIDYFTSNRSRMTFEFRNIGNIGRNMLVDRNNYSYEELVNMLESKFKFDKNISHIDDEYSKVFLINKFIIRINDWGIFENHGKSLGNVIRGRMTQNFKVSPFFEHLKENEWNY